LQLTIAKQAEKTIYEWELEAKVQKLEQQLVHEQFRTYVGDLKNIPIFQL
jgi:ribosomal protein L29